MATVSDYITQVSAIKDAADADVATEQTTIDGLKSSLRVEQAQQTADNMVSAALAELAANLATLLPVTPPSA